MRLTLIFIILFQISSLWAQEKGLHPELNQSQFLGNTYAVVVGISDYQDERIPDLKYAHKDAEAFTSFLRSSAGGSLDEDHLKVMLNEEATAAQFAIALDWLWEVAKEGDRVIIYFSGHGDVEKKSISNPGYLLCWDAPSRVYMAGGAFDIRVLNDVISTISIQNKAQVILVTDACRSGKLSGSEIHGSQATASNLAKQFSNEIKILSCQPDEYSIEGSQWGGGRGAFSYHLLEGLYGLADANKDKTVNLLEIGRFLEDHVTKEVSPQSQIPMTVGKKSTKITDVSNELLEDLIEGKRGQLEVFAATDQRGIVDDVLEKSDSIVTAQYKAFENAIEEKRFLNPPSNCAEFYYQLLSKDPQLRPLHSSMKRNYAAALQDDAQQVLNIMLNSGLTKRILKGNKTDSLLSKYPTYLNKASELLGKDHYMYSILQARRYYFEGKLKPTRKEKRSLYHKALTFQTMPHAMVGIIRSSEANQLDSAIYFFNQTIKMVPSWVEPYLAMSDYYRTRIKNNKRSEELLEQAFQVDSTSVLVWYNKANFYKKTGNYKEAEKWYNKTISGSGDDICFPCAYYNLGTLYYYYLKDPKRGESAYLKSIEIDSAFTSSYVALGILYQNYERYEEAEMMSKKSIQLDSSFNQVNTTLAIIYEKTNRFDEAEYYYKKAIKNGASALSYGNMSNFYRGRRNYELAEENYKLTIQYDSTYWWAYSHLGIIHQFYGNWEESKAMIEKAMDLRANNSELHGLLGNAYTHIPGGLKMAKEQLDKAVEIDATNPDNYIYLSQWALNNGENKKAWKYLKEGLKKGLGKNKINIIDLNNSPDFAPLRVKRKWKKLLNKHYIY